MRLQFLALLLVLPLVASQSYPFDAGLYDSQTLDARFVTTSEVTLAGTGTADKLEATVSYVPEEASTIDANPQPASMHPLTFSWTHAGPGTYDFSYTTTVRSNAQKPAITAQIPYPFQSPAEVSQYLQSQEITDSNDAIRTQANELSQGKDNAVDVVFALAQWVHQNVNYSLTSVTSQASEKSSWVMENRYGVCDEITSLFMSMARDAGIPARFVSGFAYTNLAEFPDHWGPHGWAEVWLPNIGWVPVDVTYGEIFYTDTTHIVIARSLDSKSTAVDYSLLSRGLTMQPGELKTTGTVLDKSGNTQEPVDTELSALYNHVGSNSGDVITATLTNPTNYYISTEVYLATTQETNLLDKQQQLVLLPPKDTTKVSWRVQLPAFDPGFQYTIPFTIISQNLANASTEVQGNNRYQSYPAPAEQQQVQNIIVQCDQPELLYIGENASVTCASPGSLLCTSTCSHDTLQVQFTATQAGAFPVLVKATSGSKSGSAIVTFVTSARPSPTISTTLPATAVLDDTLTLTIDVHTESISDVTVSVTGNHLSQSWQAQQLEDKQFQLRFPASYLDAGENTLTITVQGKDKNGELVQKSADTTITLQASFLQQLELFFMHLLS